MKKIIISFGLLFSSALTFAVGFQPLPQDVINDPTLLCDAKTLKNYQGIIDADSSQQFFDYNYGVFFGEDGGYLFNIVNASSNDCSGGTCTYSYGYNNAGMLRDASGICAFKGTVLWNAQIQNSLQSLLIEVITSFNKQQDFPLQNEKFGYQVVCKGQLPTWGKGHMPTDDDYQKNGCELQQVY